MLKKALFALFLITGLAFVTTNVMAQCGPNEYYVINNTECEKKVTVTYGDEDCQVFGSVIVVLAPGQSACIPIPAPYVPISTIVSDLSTMNTSTVSSPECGGPTEAGHIGCLGAAMCDMVIWHNHWHVEIMPD